MRKLLFAGAMAIACAAPAVAQTSQDNYRLQQAQDRFNSEFSVFRQESQRYGNTGRNQTRYERNRNRLDRALSDYRVELDRYQQVVRNNSGYASNNSYNNNGTWTDDTVYDPSRDYRDGDYRERVVGTDERVYRGTDGRYYCKRNDGTTGLIVGGLAGGVLGNVIDGGRSRVLGTLLGGAIGAVGGRAIERSANDRNGQVTCR